MFGSVGFGLTHQWEKTTNYTQGCMVCQRWAFSCLSDVCCCTHCKGIVHISCIDLVPKLCTSANPFISKRMDQSITLPNKQATILPKKYKIPLTPDIIKGSLDVLIDDSWQRYECILHQKKIFFYESLSKLLKGEYHSIVSLEGSTLTKHATGDDNYFELDLQSKSYKFKVSKDDLSTWIAELKKACDMGINASFHLLSKYNWTQREWPDKKMCINVQVPDLTELSDIQHPALPSTLDKLIQIDDSHLHSFEQNELDYFKYRSCAVIASRVSQRVTKVQAAITKSPLPSNFPNSFTVFFKNPKVGTECNVTVKTESCNLSDLLQNEIILRLIPLDMSCSWNLTATDYILKIDRGEEYIYNTNIPLTSLEYVRDCKTGVHKPIVFVIVNVADMEGDYPVENEIQHSQFDMKSIEEEVREDELLKIPKKSLSCFSSQDILHNFEFAVVKLKNWDPAILNNNFNKSAVSSGAVQLSVQTELCYGTDVLCTEPTQAVNCQGRASGKPISWNHVVKLIGTRYCNLPLESVLKVTLFAFLDKKYVRVGWAAVSIIDFRGLFRSGNIDLVLWDGNLKAYENRIAITLKFAKSPFPIYKGSNPVLLHNKNIVSELLSQKSNPNEVDADKIHMLLQTDILYKLTADEKELLWRYRHYLFGLSKNTGEALSKLLLSTEWTDTDAVDEVHCMLAHWPQLAPLQGLQLLDPRFADSKVRKFAVNCLKALSDRNLVEFLPQLVQVLKTESFLYNDLAEFLLVRGSRNVLVAHPLFWHLKGELHIPHICTRSKAMIGTLLGPVKQEKQIGHQTTLEDTEKNCEENSSTFTNPLARDLLNEIDVMTKLEIIATEIKEIDTHEERNRVLAQKLTDLELPSPFKLPSSSTFEAVKLVVGKCKVMKSNTKPIWLHFVDKAGKPYEIIFKVGDDLRTDILILQLMRIMDSLWKTDNLYLHMQPYHAVSTGDKVGIIEVVNNAQTSSDIQHMYSDSGAFSVLKEDALRKWLKELNSTEESYRSAMANFTVSCAGYCVATYILGIGDRHNDNIMCTKTGNMFHIDFGYVFGNRTKIPGLNITRETTPFVLTKEFVLVIKGEDQKYQDKYFKLFEELCCKAYNTLRKESSLLLTVLVMMLSADIDQLRDFEDLEYVRTALSAKLTEEEARMKFAKLMDQSLKNKWVIINNVLHDAKKYWG